MRHASPRPQRGDAVADPDRSRQLIYAPRDLRHLAREQVHEVLR